MKQLVNSFVHVATTTLSLAFLTLAGCGQDAGGPLLAKTTGTVTHQGAPVSGATVTFLYDDGQMGTGITDEQGKFNITTGGREGAPIGSAKVAIKKVSGADAAAVKPPSELKPEDMVKMATEGMKTRTPAIKNELPEKFANPSTSGFVADVRADTTNDFTYDIPAN